MPFPAWRWPRRSCGRSCCEGKECWHKAAGAGSAGAEAAGESRTRSRPLTKRVLFRLSYRSEHRAASGDRTRDLLSGTQVLCQLSHCRKETRSAGHRLHVLPMSLQRRLGRRPALRESQGADLNRRSSAYQADALPAVLPRHPVEMGADGIEPSIFPLSEGCSATEPRARIAPRMGLEPITSALTMQRSRQLN